MIYKQEPPLHRHQWRGRYLRAERREVVAEEGGGPPSDLGGRQGGSGPLIGSGRKGEGGDEGEGEEE